MVGSPPIVLDVLWRQRGECSSNGKTPSGMLEGETPPVSAASVQVLLRLLNRPLFPNVEKNGRDE